jgi:glutathione synthase
VDALEDKSDLMGYILMKLVDPYVNQNFIIRNSEALIKKSVISELGVYGYFISNGESLVENKTAGYLLRTKSLGVNEGGVATGYSALDSICLV